MQKNRLWGSQEIELATGGTWINPPARGWVASGVRYLLKDIKNGDLVLAVGPDGWHNGMANTSKDISALYHAGSCAVVSACVPSNLSPDQPVLKVDETLAAFRGLARHARDRFQGKTICVTGSAGKTSTMKVLHHVLARQASTWISRSTNSRFGVMEGVACTPPGHTYGLYEFGLFRPGDLKYMSKIARPHVAVITNIHAAHLSNFHSVDHIAESKAEIFDGVEPGGAVVLNRDNQYFELLRSIALDRGIDNIIAFGRNREADIRLLKVHHEMPGSVVEAVYRDRRLIYRTGAPGDHWVLNSLAVLAVISYLGGDLDKAAEDIAVVRPVEGRGAFFKVLLKGGSFMLVDDTYNANPASMRAAIETLTLAQPEKGGRRIIVFGDMQELGKDEINYHAGLAKSIVESGIDRVFTCGPLMKHLNDMLPAALRDEHAHNPESLAHQVKDAVQSGDVVLVKGSNESKMGAIVKFLKACKTATP